MQFVTGHVQAAAPTDADLLKAVNKENKAKFMVLCTTHRIEENCSFLSDVELYKASNDKLRAKLSPMILGKYIVGTPPEKKLPKEINISEAMRSAVAKKVGEKNIEVDLFKPAHEEIQTLRKMPWGMHNALSPGRYSPQL